MSKTIKSFAIVTGFSVITRLLSFFFKIWMSRSLGAETVGLYQISLSVLLLLFTLTAGAPTVLSRKIAEAASRGDTKREKALTAASLVMGLGISAVICLVFFLSRSKLGIIFADDRCIDIFLIMLPALITSTVYASIRSWFWGHKRFLAFSSTEFVDEIVKIVLSIVLAGGLVSSLTGAKGIALAFTVSDVLCVVILLIMFFAVGGRLAKPHGYKEIIKATVPLSATRIITNLTASLTALLLPERLVAGGLDTASATAAYGRVAGMALPLIMAPITVVSALSVVLTPDIAELAAKGDIATIRTKFTAAMTFAVLVASLFFIIYLPFGKELGYLFFKDSMAGEFVSYCSVLLFPVAIAQVTTPMLNSLGCEKNTFINSAVGAAFIIPCVIFLPKYIGVYSMAIGSGLCFTISSVMNLAVLSKKLKGLGEIKKSATTLLFSVPLGVLGLFSARLLRPIIGGNLTMVVLGVFLLLFMFIFVSAFKIADISGYIKLMRPVKATKNKADKHVSKKTKASLCKFKKSKRRQIARTYGECLNKIQIP